MSEAGQTKESDLTALVEALPDAVFVITADGTYLEVYGNLQGELGQQAQALKGKHIEEAWPPEKAFGFLNVVRDALERNEPQSVEYWIRAGQSLHCFEGRVSPMANDQGELDRVVWVAFEITERKRVEAALQQRDALMEGVAKLKTTLLTVNDIGDAMGRSLAAIGRSAKVDRVYIFERNVDTAKGRVSFSKRYEWMSRQASRFNRNRDYNNLELATYFPAWNERLEQNGVVRAITAELEKPQRALLKRERIRSLLLLPIWVELDFWGFVGFDDCREERNWEYSEVASFRVAAGSIGAFIHNKRGEELLKEAKEAADAANAAKGEFLAMMSHEIRTPMNAILGFADLLSQSAMDEQQHEYVDIINRSGKALLELINNILDYSKIESRGVELEQEKFTLETTILQALELMLVKAKERDVGLDFEIVGEGPARFLGDPGRLKQVLINLVGNAIKFTHEGSVKVTARLHPPDTEGHYRVVFQVEDTGIGIAADKIDRLFQPFSQVTSSKARNYGGTGLGLVICKRLVNKMGGDIRVESAEGEGSTFTFDILLQGVVSADSHPPFRLDPEQSTISFARQHPLRLLVAEDDLTNQKVMSQLLRRLGYQDFDVVGDGQQALDYIRDNGVDVVLLDIQMPVMDGISFTQALRAGEAGEQRRFTHLVAVTALAMPEDRERFLEVGIDDYLMKPIEGDKLREILADAHAKINNA